MEDHAMKLKERMLPLFGIVIALGLGLTAVGCGQNQADGSAPADNSAFEQSSPAQEDTNAQDDRELAGREREVARKEAELEQRMRELEARVAAVEPVEPEPRRTPVARTEPRKAPIVATPAARNEPRTIMVTLDAGTPLTIELEEAISSVTNLIGDAVSAVVVNDVVRGTRTIVPAGSRVRGSISDVVAQRKIGGQARLALDFDRLVTPSGQEIPIQAMLESAGRSQKKKDAATIGGSAAGGALLGRVLSDDDKTKGTVLGAVLGAAVGTAVASKNKADPVVFDQGMTAEIFLDGPTEVAVQERLEMAPIARN